VIIDLNFGFVVWEKISLFLGYQAINKISGGKKKDKKKRVSSPTAHRSTIYPCFLPNLGGFDRSWSNRTYPPQKYNFFGSFQIFSLIFKKTSKFATK